MRPWQEEKWEVEETQAEVRSRESPERQTGPEDLYSLVGKFVGQQEQPVGVQQLDHQLEVDRSPSWKLGIADLL